MPLYQVTLTYLVTVEAEDIEDAAQKAFKRVGDYPESYSDIMGEEVED
jgi:hypothetical protein